MEDDDKSKPPPEEQPESISLPIQFAYKLPKVSVSKPKELLDENLLPLVGGRTENRFYRIVLAVKSTNRAAISEYLFAMRPPGSQPYEYLELVATVKNQESPPVEDSNTPVLYLDRLSHKVFIKLKGLPPPPDENLEQTVFVYLTRYF